MKTKNIKFNLYFILIVLIQANIRHKKLESDKIIMYVYSYKSEMRHCWCYCHEKKKKSCSNISCS